MLQRPHLVVLIIGWRTASSQCPFPRLAGNAPDFPEQFSRVRHRSPAVLANVTEGWRAHERWNFSRFLAVFGALYADVRLPSVGSDDAPLRRARIRDFLSDPRLAGLIQFSFGDWPLHQALSADAPTPPALRRVSRQPSFSLGGRRGSGSGAHAHGEAWLAQVRGRKAWWARAPGAGAAAGAAAAAAAPGVPAAPCSWAGVGDEDAVAATGSRCEVGPREVFYVPGNWRHATCNLDDFTLAVGGRDDSSSWPPLFHAIAACHRPSIEQAFKAGSASMLMATDARGASTFHQAAAVGCMRAAELVLAGSNGLGLHAQDDDGAEPLHYAAINGHVALARFLAAARANLLAEDGFGRTPLHWAAIGDHQAVAEFLVQAR